MLQVWNQSYDNPNAARRNSLITKVELIDLPNPPPVLTSSGVADRYGNDIRTLWPHGNLTVQSAGFLGYSDTNIALSLAFLTTATGLLREVAGRPA